MAARVVTRGRRSVERLDAVADGDDEPLTVPDDGGAGRGVVQAFDASRGDDRKAVSPRGGALARQGFRFEGESLNQVAGLHVEASDRVCRGAGQGPYVPL